MSKTTWREQLTSALSDNGETWADVEGRTISETELDVEFSDGFGGAEGIPFTVWSKTRVYFPAQYDGSEWVESVPRNPNGEATPHVGGG